MLSENHRKMVSENLLKKPYNKASFVKDLINYFKPYNIQANNPLNLTLILSHILYRFPKVKELWFEKVEGLIVCDNTGWIEDAIEELETSNLIALWWDKSPSGGKPVIKLLEQTIQESEDHAFYIYYTVGQFAKYRSRIIDFAFQNTYAGKNWNENDNVGWYHSNFSEYKGEGKNGTTKQAKIVFLADKVEKLREPISVKDFEFYGSYAPPTQNNMQPYSDIDFEVEIEHYHKKVNTMSIKEIVTYAHEYLNNKGFQYNLEEIANYFLSLKTKPFIILAGISGTGKTQLPRMIAEAISFKNHIIQIPVRPDWTDGSDLLGYTSLDGKFVPKDLTIAIQTATNNPAEPYFFILDEMNLARVEHYFSDFLSIIETREWVNGVGSAIKTDPILRKEVLQTATNSESYRELRWPKNLYLIGTVNMDETTHAFSRKVLDRANSIEMNEIDLNWINKSSSPLASLTGINNSLFETEYLMSVDLTDSDKDSIQDEIKVLKTINATLQIADLQFAYRVRDEIAFYLILNKKYNLLSEDSALDFQLVQKVLPRIHGSSERIQRVLVDLLNLLEGKDFRSTAVNFSEIEETMNDNDFKYKRSTKKILFMLKRFEDDRFTSFWL
jgi:predicted nucleotidyltransferase